MISPTPRARAQLRLRFVLWAAVVMLLNAPAAADAQGLVQGVQQGAQAGNKAAGPVGGVLGGAIGGVVGVFTVVLGVGKNGQPQQTPAANAPNAPNAPKQSGSAKTAKVAKGGKDTKQQAVLTQQGEPQLRIAFAEGGKGLQDVQTAPHVEIGRNLAPRVDEQQVDRAAVVLPGRRAGVRHGGSGRQRA